MSGCKHGYKKNGDYCQWERQVDKKTVNVGNYLSCCTLCGDIKESEPEEI